MSTASSIAEEPAPQPREKIAVLFGGRSVEHEISIITGLELINALDPTRYEALPVYIAPSGRWYTGESLQDQNFYRGMPDALKSLKQVALLPVPGLGGLWPLPQEGLSGRLDRYFNPPEIVPVDVFVPAFHGQFGEDGCIQGLLEMAEAAYTSSDALPSAMAMNKYFCKKFLGAHGIPVLPSTAVGKFEAGGDLARAREKILSTPGLEKFPLFVKPCNLGSSVGISVAKDALGLNAALLKVFKYDLTAIIEPCVMNIYEINISVVDGEGEEPLASVVEIPASQTGVLTYEEKYMRGGGKKRGTRARGMASLARVIDPDNLAAEKKSAVTKYALDAYKLLGCGGIVRFDFIVDSVKDEIYFNELSPLPGSMAYYLWAKSRPQRLYTENLGRIIEKAKQRRDRKAALQRDIGFKALFR